MSAIPIQLNKGLYKKLYVQLAEQVEKQILEQTILPHQKLTPVRKMAKLLSCNTVTVVSAYKILSEKGLIYSKTGSGFYVCPQIDAPDGDYDESGNFALGSASLKEKTSYNLALTSASSNLFPIDNFKKAIDIAIDRDKSDVFSYQESNGYAPLRLTIANMLSEYSNINAPKNLIQIISGAQQGIDIIAKAILSDSDNVIMENPTYPGALSAFKSRGVNIFPANMTNDGIDIAEVERLCKIYQPKLIFIMPNNQNPTTYSYSKKKMEKLIDIAYKYNSYIIEDACTCDTFTKKYPPLKSYDLPDRVIYISSFSRALMPGLRIGFLVMPKSLAKSISDAKHSSDIASSGLIQRACELYLKNSSWDEHLSLLQNEREKKIAEFKKYLPSLARCGINLIAENETDFFMQLTNVSDIELYSIALQKSVTIVPGQIFYPFGQYKNDKIRLSISSIDLNDIEICVNILIKSMKEIRNREKIALPLM